MTLSVISVIGLGKLGLPYAAVLAQHFRVVAYDVNAQYVERILDGVVGRSRLPVSESGLPGLLSAVKSNIKWPTALDSAVLTSDITYVIVPTPSEPTGEFSLTHVLAACREIGTALKSKAEHHTVVIVSTVNPGDTHMRIVPVLERASGRKNGDTLSVLYAPVFIALGSVIANLRKPDFNLVGIGNGMQANDIGLQLHTRIVNTHAARTQHVTEYANAEITKLAINAFVTMKIAFINQVAALADHYTGADIHDISAAMGHDSRIGHRALKAGAPFGGPCFPRDGRALARAAHNLTDTALFDAIAIANADRLEKIYHHVVLRTVPKSIVVIYGRAYKDGTHVEDESAGVALGDKLSAAGYDVRYDTRNVDFNATLVIMLPSVAVFNLDNAYRYVIVDTWGCLPDSWGKRPNITYIVPGVNRG